MGIKRRLVHLIETAADAHIVRRAELHSLFEEVHLQRLFQFLNVDCVFDVGANAGQYAEMLRHKVRYQGHIISYEPIPEMVEKMRRKANGAPNWHIREAALDTAAGKKTFNRMGGDQFSSFLMPSTREVGMFSRGDANVVADCITVETRRLSDEWLEFRAKFGFARPFLKLDTQGFDLRVCEGAGEYLKDFVGIQTEIAFKRIYEGAPGFAEAISYLNSRGFELSALVPNNEGHFPKLIEMDAILVRRDLIGQ